MNKKIKYIYYLPQQLYLYYSRGAQNRVRPSVQINSYNSTNIKINIYVEFNFYVDIWTALELLYE